MKLTTGRIREHDERSKQFARRGVGVRVSVTHKINAVPLDQGNVGACTGNAAAQWLNCVINSMARRKFNAARAFRRSGLGSLSKGMAFLDEQDALAIYSVATGLDDIPGEYPEIDTGSSGLAIGKALKKFGVISRYEWTFDFESFCAAVQSGPVLVGSIWTQDMFTPNVQGLIRATGRFDPDAGHEYLVRGINWDKKLFRIRNSWGRAWGYKGDAFISMKDMEWLIIQNKGDVLIPVL